jgi:hypothetical protein
MYLFTTIPLLFTASTLAFPHLASKRQGDGGAPPNDPNLVGSILNGIEHEEGPGGSQGSAPFDFIAPILDPIAGSLAPRDLIGGLLQVGKFLYAPRPPFPHKTPFLTETSPEACLEVHFPTFLQNFTILTRRDSP